MLERGTADDRARGEAIAANWLEIPAPIYAFRPLRYNIGRESGHSRCFGYVLNRRSISQWRRNKETKNVRQAELSEHAKDMLSERSIQEEWMRRTLDTPDHTEIGIDMNTHYIKAIPEHKGRFLRVVVNHHVTPERVVTLFFDRRLRRER